MMSSDKESCKEVVMEYLIRQNRPYSATDIVMNLHNAFSRGAVQKALEELAGENRIREKIYGKQKVYSWLPSPECNAFQNGDSADQIDEKVEKADGELKKLERELRRIESKLKEVESEPTNESACQQLVELEKAVDRLRESAMNLPESEGTVTREEMLVLTGARDKLSRECKKRRNICMDIVHSILENYPIKLKCLLEEIGIEIGDDHS